jgi:hypothetical protein
MQLYHNPSRSLPYVPLAVPGAPSSADPMQMQVAGKIPLEGDPLINALGNLYLIDVEGDGRLEFLHFHGFRLMRVYRQDGTKVWEIGNPKGRLHRTNKHRDTLAVLDVDGDRGQDIVHCWADPTSAAKLLVARDGATGAVLKQVKLAADQEADDECQIAAFRMVGQPKPVVMVSHEATRAAGCRRNFVDVWARTVAYDTDLKPLWAAPTCDAGHYAWPLDENLDGVAEAVFVGKYLLNARGARQCVLPGWGTDHVDSLAVGEVDPSRPGHEVAAVGETGTRFYTARTCQPLWAISTRTIQNPQHVVIGKFSPASTGPTLVVRPRISLARRMMYTLDAKGRILASLAVAMGSLPYMQPIQNAELDGARGTEELVTSFGQVLDSQGRVRLDASWYWNLHQVPAGTDPFDQWASRPLVLDLDGDGRDEIVTWGREWIVTGKVATTASTVRTATSNVRTARSR